MTTFTPSPQSRPDPDLATLTLAEEKMTTMPAALTSTLTDRQREIVAFIKTYVADHHYPPTVREIRDAIGVASTSTVHLDLVDIEAVGVIKRGGYRSRAITLVSESGTECPAA